jgi:hypothetical protein
LIVEPNVLDTGAVDADMMPGNEEEGSDEEESEYEEEEYEEANEEEEEALDGDAEEEEEGDGTALDNTAMAVVPAVPAIQEGGEGGGVVNETLTEDELTSEPAQSSSPPTTVPVTVAALTTHPSHPANTPSAPPERPHQMKTRGKRIYFGGEPCCETGVSEGERGHDESVVECPGTGCETRWVSTFNFGFLAYLDILWQYHIRCLERNDEYWRKGWRCKACTAAKRVRC